MVVECASEINADLGGLVLRNDLDKLSNNLLIVSGLYYRHQRLFDSAFFHPALRKTDLTIKVFWRHVHGVLDRDDVDSFKRLDIQQHLHSFPTRRSSD